MMKLCLLTTILVLVAGSPTPPVFPDAVNCTLHGRSDSNFEFIGRLFYDYNLSSIRVEKNYTKAPIHQVELFRFDIHKEYIVYSDAWNTTKCKEENIGGHIPPPNFLAASNAVYIGTTKLNGEECDGWLIQAFGLTLYVSNTTHIPVQMEGPSMEQYNITEWFPGPQNPMVFSQPAHCHY